MAYLPRFLLIDLTPMVGTAATSALKALHFGNWRRDAFLHVLTGGIERIAIGDLRGHTRKLDDDTPEKATELLEAFRPEIILYRPVANNMALHRFAMELIRQSDAALALWMMDDWPERLKAENPAQYDAMHTDLTELFARSDLNLAISKGMTDAFKLRYGVNFETAHSGVRPAEWPERARPERPEIIVRYAGSLSPDMTLHSVRHTAQTISRLAESGLPIRFEGRTQPYWHEQYADEFNTLAHVSMRKSDMPAPAYRTWLSEADILLLAYNFDTETQRYARYSFANKMPETLATGVPILAYGPETLETIAHLERNGLGERVTRNTDEALEAALRKLATDPEHRTRLGQAGRDHAFKTFDLDKTRARLLESLTAISGPPADITRPLPPEEYATLDTRTFAALVLQFGARIPNAHVPKIELTSNQLDQLSGIRTAELKPPAMIIPFDDGATSQWNYTSADLDAHLQAEAYHVYACVQHPRPDKTEPPALHRVARFPTDLIAGNWGELVAFADLPDPDVLAAVYRNMLAGPAHGIGAAHTIHRLAPRPAYIRQPFIRRSADWVATRMPWLWKRLSPIVRRLRTSLSG